MRMFFLLQTLGCRPVASLDHFVPETLGSAELVQEEQVGSSKIVKVRRVISHVSLEKPQIAAIRWTLLLVSDHWDPECGQDGVGADSRLEQTRARGSRPLHPRRTLCHALPR